MTKEEYNKLMSLSKEQLEQVWEGIVSGIDVGIYADPKFTVEQMREIRLRLEEKGLNVSKYADPAFCCKEMRESRLKMMLNFGKFDSIKSQFDSIKSQIYSIKSQKYVGKSVIAFLVTGDNMTLSPYPFCRKFVLENHVKKDAWTLPGGKVESGEQLEDAICREIKEELGVDVYESGFHITELGMVHYDNMEYPNHSGNMISFDQHVFVIFGKKNVEFRNLEPNKCSGLRSDDIFELYSHIEDCDIALIPSLILYMNWMIRNDYGLIHRDSNDMDVYNKIYKLLADKFEKNMPTIYSTIR